MDSNALERIYYDRPPAAQAECQRRLRWGRPARGLVGAELKRKVLAGRRGRLQAAAGGSRPAASPTHPRTHRIPELAEGPAAIRPPEGPDRTHLLGASPGGMAAPRPISERPLPDPPRRAALEAHMGDLVA